MESWICTLPIDTWLVFVQQKVIHMTHFMENRLQVIHVDSCTLAYSAKVKLNSQLHLALWYLLFLETSFIGILLLMLKITTF